MVETVWQTPVKILLLEDSPLDAELVGARLERGGIAVELHRAHDRTSYCAELHARKYDLILADYALPDFDGLEALEAAHAHDPHLPFIFISGRVGEEVAIETMQRGATDYVLKQRMERLVPAVKRALKEAAEHTIRMRAEQRFRESETRLRDVIDALPQLVWLTTAEGALLYTNQAWKENVPRETPTWLDPSFVYPEDRRSCERSWDHAVQTHQAFSCECRLRQRRDDSWRWHLVRMVPLIGTRTEDGKSCVDWLGTATDLQEQKLHEEALRTAEKLAVVGRLSASIAHEINNPLESLTNLIFLARLEARDSPQVLHYLEMTENELARVAAITKQTLQFYRDPSTPTTVDARKILEEVLALFTTRLASKRICSRLLVEEAISFHAIKGEIRQVLINLVGNSIDAVQPGGKIEAEARLVKQGGREMVEIEVRDNGVGLAQGQAERLFEPFVSTKGAHGTGLGLWVSKGIVEKHAGSIHLACHRENGHTSTVATVLLPVKIAAELVASRSAS